MLVPNNPLLVIKNSCSDFESLEPSQILQGLTRRKCDLIYQEMVTSDLVGSGCGLVKREIQCGIVWCGTFVSSLPPSLPSPFPSPFLPPSSTSPTYYSPSFPPSPSLPPSLPNLLLSIPPSFPLHPSLPPSLSITPSLSFHPFSPFPSLFLITAHLSSPSCDRISGQSELLER